jgi:hypothetical protein
MFQNDQIMPTLPFDRSFDIPEVGRMAVTPTLQGAVLSTFAPAGEAPAERPGGWHRPSTPISGSTSPTSRPEPSSPSGIAAHRSKLPPVPCVIVFGGNDQEPLTLELDVDAEDVAKSLRGHSLQRIEVKERVIWVNPQNVLYVEDASIPSPAE